MPFTGKSSRLEQAKANIFHYSNTTRSYQFSSLFLQSTRLVILDGQSRTPHSSLSSSPRNRPPERPGRSRNGTQGSGGIPCAIRRPQINKCFLGKQPWDNNNNNNQSMTKRRRRSTIHQWRANTRLSFNTNSLKRYTNRNEIKKTIQTSSTIRFCFKNDS
jgi:hypothetical protein